MTKPGFGRTRKPNHMSNNVKRKATKRPVAPAAREGSKAGRVFDLLKRKCGATLDELIKTTGWQAHSVRGFLAGPLAKKICGKVASTKGEDGIRRYSING
jgi:hypothetical protein